MTIFKKYFQLIFGLFFLLGFATCNPKPALGKIECERIEKIILKSKGFNGVNFKQLEIIDKERIEEICSIMNSSQRYKYPNTKLARGKISIIIFYSDSKFGYNLVETVHDGYIMDGVRS